MEKKKKKHIEVLEPEVPYQINHVFLCRIAESFMSMRQNHYILHWHALQKLHATIISNHNDEFH